MAVAQQIELRLATLEAEVAELKQQAGQAVGEQKHWVDEIYGLFAGDPDFLEAMRLGRKYRESLRPKPAKRPAKQPVKQRSR